MGRCPHTGHAASPTSSHQFPPAARPPRTSCTHAAPTCCAGAREGARPPARHASQLVLGALSCRSGSVRSSKRHVALSLRRGEGRVACSAPPCAAGSRDSWLLLDAGRLVRAPGGVAAAVMTAAPLPAARDLPPRMPTETAAASSTTLSVKAGLRGSARSAASRLWPVARGCFAGLDWTGSGSTSLGRSRSSRPDSLSRRAKMRVAAARKQQARQAPAERSVKGDGMPGVGRRRRRRRRRGRQRRRQNGRILYPRLGFGLCGSRRLS